MKENFKIRILKFFSLEWLPKDPIQEHREKYKDGLLAFLLRKKREQAGIIIYYDCLQREVLEVEALVLEDAEYPLRTVRDDLIESIKGRCN